MNAAQLEAEAQVKEETQRKEVDPKSIIENLIRRLYTAVRYREDPEGEMGEIKEHVENLYKKAVSKEFKLTQSLVKNRERIEEEEEEIAKETLLDEKIFHIVIFMAFWTLGAIILTSNLTPQDWIKKLVGLLSTFPIPYTVNCVVNLIYRKRKVRKERKEASLKTEELYQLDNKIGNLEFDLEQIHNEITSNGMKLVYVIDELDKLEKDVVKELLKYFKNLFTLSDALFIFIGGEELYNIGREKKKNSKSEGNSGSRGQEEENSELYRQKEYTYFTSRYFLSRPLYPDLSRFFDEIVEDWGGLAEKEKETFERSLLFDAKNDYFDLKTRIRDKITRFEDGKPVIEINKEELLSPYEQRKKGCIRLLPLLVEGKYLSHEHSKWQENEKLFRVIFEQADKIYDSYFGQQFSDPAGEKVEDELIRDFHGLLYRYGAFTIQNETSQNIKGVSAPIRTYRYVGDIPNDLPDKLEEPVEYERRFIAKFEEWVKYLISVVNPFREAQGDSKLSKEEFLNNPQTILRILAEWGHNIEFNSYKNMYDNITGRKPPHPYQREQVEKATINISNYLQQFKGNLPILIARAITQLYSDLHLQLQNLQQNGKLFSGSASQIREVFVKNRYNPPVVFKPELDRQILLAFNLRRLWKEIERIKDILKDNQHTHRIVCVEENLETEEEIPGLSILLTQTPEKLESSIKALYEDLEKFFGGGN